MAKLKMDRNHFLFFDDVEGILRVRDSKSLMLKKVVKANIETVW